MPPGDEPGPRAATCCRPLPVLCGWWKSNTRGLSKKVSEGQLVESHLLPIFFRCDDPTSTKRHVFQKRVAGRATGYEHVGIGYEIEALRNIE